MRYSLACLSLLLLGSSAFAQAQNRAGTQERVTPPQRGTYDLTTGFQPGAPTARSGPETIFDNSAGTEYYWSMFSHAEEYIDEIAFVARDLDGDEQINGLRWEYCTFSSAPVDLELRFYTDTVFGAGPSSWFVGPGTNQNAACAYGLSGLPPDSNPADSIPTCWQVDLDLECGFECSLPQELTPGGMTEFLGVGWMYDGGQSGPVLDSTWGPGGPGTAVPGYGSQDYFELFDLALGLGQEYVGTFNFGGGSKIQASFQLTLYGNGILDTDVVNASAPDIGDLHCLKTDTELRPGASVTWSLVDPGTPGLTYALIVGTQGDPLGYGPIAGPTVSLLIDPAFALMPPTPLLMPGTTPMYTSPPLPGLPPSLYVQAFGFSGGVARGNVVESSNALRHRN